MAEISKPDYSLLWASGGASVAPSSVKIQTGWTAEVPPFQWENWSQNRQDQAIAHILQHGISVWDGATEYQWTSLGTKSLVMGSNGSIYRAKQVNVNQDPVTDMSNTYWELAFASLADVYTKSQVDAKTTIASTAESQALTNNTNLITPLRLKESFQGANQSLTANGFQKYPGGLIEQWGTKVCTYDSTTAGGFSNSVTFSVAFTSAPTVTVTRTQGLNTAAAGNPDQIAATATTSGFLIVCAQEAGTNNYTVAWRAVGY